MNAASEKDTKEKIIAQAKILFAQNGFEATSIRDICNAANVNVAAINYHFKNKNGLYQEIIERSYYELSQKIDTLHKETIGDTKKLALAILHTFLEDPHSLVTTFKLFLEQNTDALAIDDTNDFMDGPPGSKAIQACLEAEINKKLSPEDTFWAVKVIFTHVLHTALLLASPCCKRLSLKNLHSDETVTDGIKRLVNLVLIDLKK